MTQKPPVSETTTSKPQETTSNPQPSTSKPEPSPPKSEASPPKSEGSTSKPEASNSKPLEDVLTALFEDQPIKLKENSTADKEKVNSNDQSTTSTTAKPMKLEEIISPGKIKVQIIEAPLHMSPVPGEEMGVGHNTNAMSQSAEILLPRKCASGFTRDTKGRCRRVRKPSGSL